MPAFLFPNNVWAMILDFMHDGRDISRGYGVCRKWRGFLLQEDDGEARWKRLCLSYNLPIAELSGARKKQAVTYQEQRSHHGDSTLPRANYVYKDRYIQMRHRICRYCRCVKSQTLRYPLEYRDESSGFSFPLCYPCRSKVYPATILTFTQIKRYFQRYGVDHVQMLLDRGLPHMQVLFGSKPGYMFRLVDVVEVAKDLVRLQRPADNNDAPPTAPCTKRARKLAIMTLDNVDQTFQSVMEELVEVDLRREGDIQELLHLF